MNAKRAAAYIRVSSEEQTEGWSLDGQQQQIREYAARNGYEIVQVYRDETSGSREKRPGLDQMLMDAHAGLFSAIIIIHTSRLFRNLALARRYKDLLRNKLNIEVLFVNQPIMETNDPMSFVMETMNELFDEYYLHQLRFWTTPGQHLVSKHGRSGDCGMALYPLAMSVIPMACQYRIRSMLQGWCWRLNRIQRAAIPTVKLLIC